MERSGQWLVSKQHCEARQSVTAWSAHLGHLNAAQSRVEATTLNTQQLFRAFRFWFQ
jgi:hypothetical protein